MSQGPAVIRVAPFDAQVCVPKEWTDEQVLDFFKKDQQWEGDPAIRKQGDRLLAGADERVPCATHADFVHIMIHY